MPDILIAQNVQGEAADALSQRFTVERLSNLWKDRAEHAPKHTPARLGESW